MDEGESTTTRAAATTEEMEQEATQASRLANRITQMAEQGQRVFFDIGRTLGRTAASASELLSDAELRRKGRILLVHEASRGMREIQQRVGNAAGNLGRSLQQGAGTIQRGIASGPRQLQGALERVRQQVNEVRWANLMEIHNNLAVDVQIAEKLYEDSPQEIRSRLWAVLVQNATHRPLLIRVSGAIGQESQNDALQSSQEGADQADDDDWEILDSPFKVERMQREASDEVCSRDLADSESLLEAMSGLEWPLEDYICEEDSNYRTLIQITIGQDEVDEIIRRDIHRTFPELPHFNLSEKRAALFNILKAYSLNDLEVGYCQGMGFVTGIILLYLPEEWAYRMLCVLMSEKHTNLRRFYVPGLEPLKMELWKMEWLLERHLPILAAHLKENGVGATLYASQWFLTCFSCPFPDFFSARVLDFMLLEKSCVALPRTAFSVLVQLAEGLLEIDNFEDVLTHIKVKPLSWNVATMRRVLSSSLSSPITEDEVQRAEEAYHKDHQERLSTVESEALQDAEASVNMDGVTGAASRALSEEDLQLMLSMDLLLDVDVPDEDPITGDGVPSTE